MNTSTWQNAEITPVYIKSGTFQNDSRPRFRAAPFCFVELNGVTYLGTVGTEVREEDAASSDTGIDNLQMRSGFGFYRQPYFVDDSAIGDGSDDTILAVHKLGPI